MRRVMYENEKERFLLRRETLENVKEWLIDNDKEYSCPISIGCINYFKNTKKIACFMWFNEYPNRIIPLCPCQFLSEEEVINWVLWQIQQDKEYSDQ